MFTAGNHLQMKVFLFCFVFSPPRKGACVTPVRCVLVALWTSSSTGGVPDIWELSLNSERLKVCILGNNCSHLSTYLHMVYNTAALQKNT